jgi:hypothetical protein
MQLPQRYFDKVKNHYHGDDKKTWAWFETIHPKLGMLSPMAMIKLGRTHKVIQLIEKEIR